MKLIICPLLTLVFSWSAMSAVGADNSVVNKRDRGAQERTADKHGTSEADIKISSQIRQSLVNDRNLSTYAQNIKIITVNGEVTLKGPVKSIQEQTSLTATAKKISGVKRVVDQMDIVTQ